MKLREEDNQVFSNTASEKRFSIDASAKVFRILSSGIYSKKIKAIVRELSCNAYDSHVVAGKADVPFEIHIPNQWEPVFEVQDYGTGLSRDEIENIYTTYGASTKTNSNDLIGAFGLGSKSPFAYTDTFTITSVKDGIKLVYSAFINQQGEPAISEMSESETDEVNGVRISVPVNSQDFNEFRKECREVFKFFRVLPIFNEDGFEVDNSILFNSTLERRGFACLENDSNYSSDTVIALMGNVGYVVNDVSQITGNDSLEDMALVIKFDIGDLDIPTSRETISFDDDTKKVFVDRINEVVSVLSEEFQISMNEQTTLFGINEVMKNAGIFGPLLNYHGVDVRDIIEKSSKQNFIKTLFNGLNVYDNNNITVNSSRSHNEYSIYRSYNEEDIFDNFKLIFVFDREVPDTEKHRKKRLEVYSAANDWFRNAVDYRIAKVPLLEKMIPKEDFCTLTVNRWGDRQVKPNWIKVKISKEKFESVKEKLEERFKIEFGDSWEERVKYFDLVAVEEAHTNAYIEQVSIKRKETITKRKNSIAAGLPVQINRTRKGQVRCALVDYETETKKFVVNEKSTEIIDIEVVEGFSKFYFIGNTNALSLFVQKYESVTTFKVPEKVVLVQQKHLKRFLEKTEGFVDVRQLIMDSFKVTHKTLEEIAKRESWKSVFGYHQNFINCLVDQVYYRKPGGYWADHVINGVLVASNTNYIKSNGIILGQFKDKFKQFDKPEFRRNSKDKDKELDMDALGNILYDLDPSIKSMRLMNFYKKTFKRHYHLYAKIWKRDLRECKLIFKDIVEKYPLILQISEHPENVNHYVELVDKIALLSKPNEV